jgi:hypothetical protein
VVGDPRGIAVDAAGEREHAGGNGTAIRGHVVEVALRRRRQRLEMRHFERAHAVGMQRMRAVEVGEREARIGAANIREQCKLRAHVRRSGNSPPGTVTGRNSAASAGPQLPAG